MITHSLRVAALLLASTMLAGTAAAEVTEKSSQTHPLAAAGTVSLSNMNGDVEIVAWDRDEIQIDAEKFAKDVERLERITIEVDAQPDRVAIKTKYPKSDRSWFGGWKNNPGGVRYTLRVPARLSHLKVDTMNSDVSTEGVRGNVKIATMNGRINATGLAADANLDTMNGRISASFDHLGGDQKVSLDTMNGSCEVFLPADASARIKASSMNGRVRSELPVTIEKSSRRSLRGSLGAGEASLTLDSMNGSLSIRTRS